MMVRISKNLARNWVALALLAALAACQSKPSEPLSGQVKIGKPYVIDGKTYYPEYDADYDKVGEASWYGPGFHGKYTASGEVFNQDDLTAAHPTLPMPSLVRVTNQDTGKSLIVRINDRGPFKSSRIIDLSRASAKKLGVTGTTQVRVQFLRDETTKYLTEVSGGKKIDMFALNNEIGSAVDTSLTASGSSGAPVASVASNDLSSPVASSQQAAVQEPIKPLAANTDNTAAEPRTFQPPPRVRAKASSSASSQGGSQSQAALIKDMWSQDDASASQPAVKSSANVAKPVQFKHEATAKHTATAENTVAQPAVKAPAKNQTKSSVAALDASMMSPASGGNASALVIQVGSFSTEQNALKIKSKLNAIGDVAVDKVSVNNKTWYRVRLGPFNDQQSAQAALEKVRSSGAPDARITRKL